MNKKKSNKKPAILFTGNEIGGQMQLLAETFRKKGFKALAATLDYNDSRGYNNDVRFRSVEKGIRYSRLLFFLWALTYFDVFHFIFGVSFWSFWRFHKIDLPILRLFKKKIVVHFRGSDIIDKHTYYDYLKEINSWEEINLKRMSRPDQLAKIKKWSKYADVLLVSTPNLLEIVPKAKLSPQLIDINYWKTDKKPLSRQDGIFRIAHAPTMQKVKGTEFIISTIEALKAEGYQIDLVIIENCEHDNVKGLYELCDIGIDQLLIGWHGKVAVELMAMGKPVICNINPKYLKNRPDLPIIQADRNDLGNVMLELINSPDKIEEIGKLSLQYVSKYHDVFKETDRLLELYTQDNAQLK